MRARAITGFLCLLIAVLLSGAGAFAQDGQAAVVIPVKGEISPALSAFVCSQIQSADAAGRPVILEIDTYGGYIDDAVKIKDAIFACEQPTMAYINDKAISAGVLIAVSCAQVYMSPTASIGAAEIVPYSEKALSAWVGILKGAAGERGRDALAIEAMADSRTGYEGYCETGALLTLITGEALELGICDARYSSLDELLDAKRLSAIRIEESLSVKAAKTLTSTWLTSLLFAVGAICLIAEAFIPGFGIFGIVGLLCLGLYFFGGILAGYAQWWSIILMILGAGLLVVEMLIPGFGIAGIAGIACLLAGLFFSSKSVQSFAIVCLTAVCGLLLSAPLLFRLFTRSKMAKRLSLDDTLNSGEGYLASPTAEIEIGAAAVALTDLRPSGTIAFGERRFDAVTSGDYIKKDSRVKVVSVTGQSVKVISGEADA